MPVDNQIIFHIKLLSKINKKKYRKTDISVRNYEFTKSSEDTEGHRRKSMTEHNKLNEQCEEIYEEIESTRKQLRWTVKDLCAKCFNQMEYEDEILDDPKEEIKYYEKYKKILKRKNWKEKKASEQTLHNLECLRDAICKTEEYGEIGSVVLLPKEREKLKQISKELESKLMEKDCLE